MSPTEPNGWWRWTLRACCWQPYMVPANLTETQATGLLLEDLVCSGQADRLEVVLVDKGVPERSARRLTRQFGFEVRRVGWDPQPTDPVTGTCDWEESVQASGPCLESGGGAQAGDETQASGPLV